MAEISILIPLIDMRGDGLAHLRTWTEGQTLERDRYEVVVCSDGEDPEIDRAVEEMLEPHDIFHLVPGADLMGLWDAAARQATSPWLLVTENHCEARPDCIERTVEGVGSIPDLEAASLNHGHVTTSAVGELGARWFDGVYEEWDQSGEWNRLNSLGYVIRRDSYESAGGLSGGYGEFTQPLLAARLDDRGAVVSHFPEAQVLHVHVHDISEHHEHSTEYALGECKARPSLEPSFAERYFGHQHLLWNRRSLEPRVARLTRSVLCRELIRAGRHPRDVPGLLAALGSALPAAMAGERPRAARVGARVRWNEIAASFRLLPAGWRYNRFLRAQDEVVEQAQLHWIASHREDGETRVGMGFNPIETIGEGALIGIHGLESHDGRTFRWSEPVLTVRLDSLSGAAQLRIDTGVLRGSPLASVIAAYAGTTRLPSADVHEEGATLVIDLPAGAKGELTLLCRRLKASADERRLGLPVFSLELAGVGRSQVETPARAPQPVG